MEEYHCILFSLLPVDKYDAERHVLMWKLRIQRPCRAESPVCLYQRQPKTRETILLEPQNSTWYNQITRKMFKSCWIFIRYYDIVLFCSICLPLLTLVPIQKSTVMKFYKLGKLLLQIFIKRNIYSCSKIPYNEGFVTQTYVRNSVIFCWCVRRWIESMSLSHEMMIWAGK